jgi:predicted branched-subunit amino acid permease
VIDRRALLDSVPLLVPAVPFGFVLGLATTESAMPVGLGWSTSVVVFAGASQLAMVTLAGAASVWAVIVAALVINSRHVMYSAAMAPMFRHQPRWFRWAGPFLLIDQVFALATFQTDRPPAEFRRYYLSAGLLFYATWIAFVSIGMIVGPIVPASWRLDFAPAVMFTGLVLYAVNRRPAAVAAVVGGLVGLAAVGLRDRLGIVVGALAGVVAGAIAERWEPPTAATTSPSVTGSRPSGSPRSAAPRFDEGSVA